MRHPPIRLRAARWLSGAALLLATTSSPAEPASPSASAVLSVRLVELRNSNGGVGCALFASEKGFPKDPTAAAQTTWCPIVNRESSCSFVPIPAGIYAVACFHDENNNRKMDKGLFGIPTEGVVVSNHAKGFMGPPRFSDARFSFAGTPAELRLKMGY
jgi:uncharacterized protein (DUF2141 family)